MLYGFETKYEIKRTDLVFQQELLYRYEREKPKDNDLIELAQDTIHTLSLYLEGRV